MAETRARFNWANLAGAWDAVRGTLNTRMQELSRAVNRLDDRVRWVSVKEFRARGNGSGSDVAAIRAAVAVAVAADFSDVPSGGLGVGSIPTLYFPAGYYLIDDEIDLSASAYWNIVSDGDAIIRQMTAGKRIFKHDSFFQLRFQGIRFVGGTRHIDAMNANTDSAQLIIRDCEFQLSTDWAIHTLSSAPISSPTASTTLAASPSASATSISVASASGFAAEDMIAIVNDLGEYHATHITSIAGTDFNLREPIPSWWSGSAKASSGNAVKSGNFVMSSSVTIEGRSRFIRCKRVLHNVCEAVVENGVWIDLHKSAFDENRAAFKNISTLRFTGIVGVPQMGSIGVDRVEGARWIDNYVNVHAYGARFGGEDGGMPIVYHFGNNDTSSPFFGGQVVLDGCQITPGPTAGTDTAVVNLQTGIPQLISIHNCHSIAGQPMILNGASLDLDTFFDSIADARFKYFIDIDHNAATSTCAIPDQLKPFVARRNEYTEFTAAPTSGHWAAGQRVRNSAPSEAGSAGSKYVILEWVCVTAGEPGTWLEVRALTGN